MSSSDRRERAKQEVRQRILDAGRDLLLAEGIEGFSMRKLAKRIDYTATAIYFHFPDKESLLTELCAHDFTSLVQALRKIEPDDDPVHKLRQLGRALIEFALKNQVQYQFMFMNPAVKNLPKSPAIERGNPTQDGYAFLRALVQEAFNAKRFRKEFRDVDQLAQLIWSGVHGILSLYIAKGEDPWVDWAPIRPTALRAVDITLRGLTDPPAEFDTSRG